ncbi:MAG: DUF1801 domain-containing protein [Bacteroidia bacterium]|nr:DUF1801 domain-containing protein [Bacteroidia bacterium]NNJ55810.1 hypothetical protein [Bacteroidia bacterium]
MSSVIDYIYNQKGSQHELFLMLHNFISEYSEIEASLKYKIPFYAKEKVICYLNPVKPIGVELVFWNALKMKDSLPLLDMKKRKWFAGITYRNLEDIDFDVLDKMIKEAIKCDSQYNKSI